MVRNRHRKLTDEKLMCARTNTYQYTRMKRLFTPNTQRSRGRLGEGERERERNRDTHKGKRGRERHRRANRDILRNV